MLRILGLLAASVIAIVGGAWGIVLWMDIDPSIDLGKGRVASEAAPRQRHYVDLDPITVPLLQSDRRVATLVITVKFEAADESSGVLLTRHLPRLADAYLKDLYGYLPQTLRLRNKIDRKQLKERLLRVGKQTLGGRNWISDLSVIVETLKHAGHRDFGSSRVWTS